jgi:hypothetical protein
MKFIQLLTALALVATSSVANASQVSHDKTSCKQGETDAKRAVDDKFNNDCNNALDRRFTQDVNNIRDRKFPNNARNWKEREYNKCGRDAIKKETDRIGKKCRNSNHAAKDCNGLGKAAADNIVQDSGVCPSHNGYGASHNNLKKFRHECRSVAYGQCQGAITRSIRNCGGKSQSLRKQSQLQKKCKDEVDSMTDNRHGEEYLDFMYDQYLEDESSGDEYDDHWLDEYDDSSGSGDDSDSSDY